MRLRANALFSSPALTTFLALVLVQGFHEVEHFIQLLQRFAFGVPNGNGILGSLADIEPVHFIYNSLYLGLLIAVFVLLGLHRDGPTEHGRLVGGLLTFALVFQMWHELEHVFKLTQYFALHVNGTGGILGQGPGAIWPLFPIPLLHLAYNAVAYAPALATFIVLVGRIKVLLGRQWEPRTVSRPPSDTLLSSETARPAGLAGSGSEYRVLDRIVSLCLGMAVCWLITFARPDLRSAISPMIPTIAAVAFVCVVIARRDARLPANGAEAMRPTT